MANPYYAIHRFSFSSPKTCGFLRTLLSPSTRLGFCIPPTRLLFPPAAHRIIRPPRKRSGHVILDLCMPLAASEQSGTPSTGGKSSSGSSSSSGTGSSSGRSSRRSSSSGRLAVQSSQGHLERHVVSRSDAAKWMGSAGYALARSSQWGDLWPSFYNLNPKRQVLRQAEEVVEMQGRAGEEAE